MDVEDVRKAKVQLVGLSPGDVYEWGEERYLKLSHHSAEVCLSNDNGDHYGVNIRSGVIIKQQGEEMVEHLKIVAKIVGW